jgi:hypothetical protein
MTKSGTILLWLKGAVAALVVAISLASCKDKSEDFTDEETIIENAAIGDNEADEASQVSYSVEFDVKGGRTEKSLPACAIVTNDKASKILTIDFGSSCVGAYGRTRSGKIIILYNSLLGDSLANRAIIFDNYKVNSRSVSGMIELSDISKNPSGNLQLTRKVTDLKITFPTGKHVTLNGTRTREWIEGAGDNNADNNKYRITGTLTGVSSSGKTFTHEITTPIIVDFSCSKSGKFARVAGIVETTKVGGLSDRKRTVDYGDGTCDNVITVTTFRRTYTIITD